MEIKEAIDIMYGEYIRCKDKNLSVVYMKAIIALEKEEPIKPYKEELVGIDRIPDGLCPCCGKYVSSFIGHKISYCQYCGQAILWE